MKKLSLNKKNLVVACVIAPAITLLAGLIACNKPFPDTLENTGSVVTPGGVERKILFIVVDGAVGTEVRDALPPTLNSLGDFSIYSWDGLTDFKDNPMSNGLAWSTLLTGANVDKHKVTGDDFSGNDLATYPSLFSRLKQQKPQLRTTAFCASPELADNLAADATEKKSFAGDDAGVKEAVKTELSTKDPDLLLAQFHSVDAAGSATSYTLSSPEYKASILQVDTYIGEILTAMRSRPSFKNENWMVVITSNKGSNTAYDTQGKPWFAFDDKRHNTFFFCYNPRFKSQNPTRPGSIIPFVGSSPVYSGNVSANTRAKVLNDGGTYDIGASGDFTIQCKVKMPTASNYAYPAFLSKRASFDGGVVGWVFFLENDYWMINFGQSGFGNRQRRGHKIADNQWHTLTAVIKQEGAARNVYVYTDGVLWVTSTRDIAPMGNLNSPNPLTVGSLPGSVFTTPSNYFVTDIRMYNTALPGDYIAGNYCKTEIPPSDPYINNLLGFWPCTNVTPNKRMPDLSPNKKDFVLEAYSGGQFSDLSTNVCPPIVDGVYKTVPNSVDIAVQVFQWFGIAVPPSWNLDGKNWVPSYSDIEG